MKRIGKRVISWLCVLIMTISMAVPVSVCTKATEPNYPGVYSISHRKTTDGYIPSVAKDLTPLEVTFYLSNENEGTGTSIVSNILLTFTNDSSQTVEFVTNKKCSSFNTKQQIYTPSINMTTESPVNGVYSLSKVKLSYEGSDETKEVNASDILGGNDMKIKVVSGGEAYDDVQIGLNQEISTETKEVTIDNSNPEAVVLFYIKSANAANIKSVRLYTQYTINNTAKESSNQGSVKKVDDNTVSMSVRYSSGWKTSEYTPSRIDITDTNDLTYTYYNTQLEGYKDKGTAFTTNAKVNFTNNVTPGLVSLNHFYFMNTVINKTTTKQTANISNGSTKLKVYIDTSSPDNETTLKSAIVKYTCGGNTYEKTIDTFDSVGSGKYTAWIDVPQNQAVGIYRIDSIELTSSKDVTKKYIKNNNEANAVEFTPQMGCNSTLIVKNTDAIVPEETGAASKKSSVTKTSDGKSSAQVSVDNSKVAADGELDSLGKKFANEKYDFTVESSAIPDNTNLEIGKVLTGNTYDIAKEVVKNDSSIASDFRVFEINLLGTGDKKVQPNGDVSISTDIPSGFKNMVVYRIEDGTTNKVKVPAHIENGKLVFDTNHFSTYILAQSTSGSGATESGNSSGDAVNSGDDSDDTGVTDNDGDEHNSSDSSSNTSPANNSSTGAVAVENKITKDSSGDSVASIKLSSGDKLAGVDANKLDAQAKAVLNQSFTFDVKAGNGVIPSGASMKISKVVTGTQYSDAKAVTNAVADKIAVFEIDLLSSSNAKIQPNGKLSITTDIPSGFDTSRVAVYRLSTDGKSYTKLSSSVSGGKVIFETDHFSTYMIVQESAEAVAVKAPVTGDNSPLALLVFVLLSAMVTLGVSIKRNFYK